MSIKRKHDLAALCFFAAGVIVAALLHMTTESNTPARWWLAALVTGALALNVLGGALLDSTRKENR